MVETSEVNDKFKNLLRMKISEKEKAKAEEEFGQRPEEFITSAYIKKREESLLLEKELEAKESLQKKRDMTNLFKEMLDSGSYARSNFIDPTEPTIVSPIDIKTAKSVSDAQPEVIVPATLVKTVLEKVVPESSREVVTLIEEQAKMEAFKIVKQLEANVEDDDREEARVSAKERYLQRKKAKND
jgi:hypothetical protein